MKTLKFFRSDTKIKLVGLRLVTLFSKSLLILFAALVTMQPGPIEARSLNNLRALGTDFAEIVEKVSPAVVFIKVEQIREDTFNYGRSNRPPNNPFDLFNDDFMRRFFGRQYQQRQAPPEHIIGQGSGFIISKDGFILTNNHVAGEADKISVKLQDGREFKAKLVGTDPRSDVALIKIEANNLPTLGLGDSDKLRVGEWVLAVGNPFGLAHTVTAGIVSAKGRSGVGITDYEDFIQTDAAINPGNSGGPLINLDGKAIGINTAIFSKSGGYMGIGFTIPINMVKVIRDQLISNGKVQRGYLGVGIQALTPDLAASFGLKNGQGILVADVAENSPAEKAGLHRGDVIQELNGSIVKDVSKFRNRIALTTPGQKVQLTIWRKQKQISLGVVISRQPDADQKIANGSIQLEKLGFTVSNLTAALAEQFGYQDEAGVLITDVNKGSVAAWAGLRPGMLIQEINQKSVGKVTDFKKYLPKKGNVLLLVKAGQQTLFITFTLS